MTTYDSICKQLDALTVSYFNKLNEYNHHWQDAADHFQQGFVDLAHAKYTMGARTLSQYSYDKRMKAILQVDIDEQDQMHPKQVIQHTTTKQLDHNDDKDNIELKEKKKKSTNPLHWFGLFVSPSLRLSQDHFKKATTPLISQVNRVRELKEMEKRYHELLEEKLALQLEKTHLQKDVVY